MRQFYQLQDLYYYANIADVLLSRRVVININHLHIIISVYVLYCSIDDLGIWLYKSLFDQLGTAAVCSKFFSEGGGGLVAQTVSDNW